MNRAATPPPWRGTITLMPMAGVFRGIGGDTPEHCHLAHKLVVGAAAVVAGPSALPASRGAVAVPAGAAHRVLAAERPVLLVYLDARRYRWRDADRLAARWRGVTPDGPVDPLVEDIVACGAAAVDDRALVAVQAMADGDTLDEIGHRLRLSASRVTHLVTDQLGAPPRAWRTWLRLRAAIELVGEGQTVTAAGHAAGFADSSHFSRSCSQSLGIPPSGLRAARIDHAGPGRAGPAREPPAGVWGIHSRPLLDGTRNT